MKKQLLILSLLLLSAGCTSTGTYYQPHQTISYEALRELRSHIESTNRQNNHSRQFEAISSKRFRRRKILNNKERRLYWLLVKYCQKYKFRLFAQVSLGEILCSEDNDAYHAINCKRVDFCITNSFFEPVAVIEYQGDGHHNETSEIRDKIKRKALVSAGIAYVEIYPEQESEIENILDLYVLQ